MRVRVFLPRRGRRVFKTCVLSYQEGCSSIFSLARGEKTAGSLLNIHVLRSQRCARPSPFAHLL